MRSRWILAVGLAAVITGYWAIGSSESPGPNLTISSVIDMGTLEHDEYKNVVVRYRNTGTRTLKLQEPLAGCTCTVSKLRKSVCEPGESGEIEFVFHAVQQPGAAVEQSVVIPSNCSQEPNRSIVLRGRMQGALFAAPATVHVNALIGDKWEQPVTLLHSDPASRYRILDVTSNTTLCRFFHDPIIHDKCTLRIVSDGISEAGTYHALIFVHTDLPQKSVLEIPLSIEVRSRLKVVPSPLLFARDPSSGEYSPETLTVRGPVAFDLVTSAAHPYLSVESIPQADTDQTCQIFTVRVSTPPDQIQRGTLSFQIEGISHETHLSVPFLIAP